MLAEWGRVWVALPWGGGAVGETVNKIKYKGERDIPVSVEEHSWGRKHLHNVAEPAKADWLGSARLCEPNPRLGLARLMNRTGSGQLGSRLALALSRTYYFI